jgi:tRNA(fMet)-specific endonuclease VapC
MAYLLDTNSWIHYLKHSYSPIRTRLEALQPDEVVSCSVVNAELLHGAEKYGNRDRRVTLVQQTVAPFCSFPFDDDAASIYATIRHSLEVTGQIIGPLDLQIAAICLLHKFVLVTSNTGEFSRVQRLQIEDWLKPHP